MTPFPLTVAIDAQVSVDTAGGTETALKSLVAGVGALKTEERFVLLGLQGHAEKWNAHLGNNQRVMAWPGRYSWYRPNGVDRPKPQGPGPRALRWRQRLGPFGTMVTPLDQMYKRLTRPAVPPAVSFEPDEVLDKNGVSVVHFPYPSHFKTRRPFLYEPWGLPHYHQPEAFSEEERSWMDQLYRDGCEKAALVVTATQWVKRDIVVRYGVSPDKIAVIPRRPLIPKYAPVHAGRMPPDLPKDFALFPAMTWPTKNHLGLIRALVRLRERYGHRPTVLCTGRIHGPQWPAIEKALRAFSLEKQVRFTGPVDADVLHSLFGRAQFLVFPSLFEGLGLPVLEAFHHGLPVLAARSACLPEVAGEAACFFDPSSDDSFVEGLRRIIVDVAYRSDLGRRGKERLRTRTPGFENMARMFLACYRRAAGVPLSPEDRERIAFLTDDRRMEVEAL